MSGFPAFMIKSLSGNPILIVGCFIEWRSLLLVSDYDVIFKLKGQASIKGVGDNIGEH